MLYRTRRLKNAVRWIGAIALVVASALAGYSVMNAGNTRVEVPAQPKPRAAGQYRADQVVAPASGVLAAPPTLVQMFDTLSGYGWSPDHPVAITHDGGATWTDATPRKADAAQGGIVKGYFTDSQTGWTFDLHPGEDVTVYGTRDGGRSWSKLATVPVKYGDGNMSVTFADAQHGWFEELVAGMGQHAGELFATRDGGQTWSKVADLAPGDSAPFGGQITVQADGTIWLNASQRAAAYVGGPGFLWLCRSTDAGRTWTKVNLPVPEANRQDTTSVSPPVFFGNKGLLSVLFSGGSPVLYASEDGGRGWVIRGLLPTGNWPVFADDLHGWQTDGRLVYRTRDGGRSWETLTAAPALLEALRGRYLSQLDFVDAQHGWAVLEGKGPGVKTVLLATSDGGPTWRKTM